MPRRNHRVDHEPLVIPAVEVKPLRIGRGQVAPELLHPAHQARLDREAARRALTVCAMPLCNAAPMRDPDVGGIGICFNCALDAVDYFAKLDEIKPLTERKLKRQLRERLTEQRRASEQESRATQPGWVYYIRVTDRIKIGYSTDVKKRMRAYPPHSELLAVHPGTPTLEREMHSQFAGLLAQGREWFREGRELLDHIDAVVREFGPPPKRMVYTFREGTTQRIKPRH